MCSKHKIILVPIYLQTYFILYIAFEKNITGYENMKASAKRRGVEIQQSAAQGAIQRRRARLVGKSSWLIHLHKDEDSIRKSGELRAVSQVAAPGSNYM